MQNAVETEEVVTIGESGILESVRRVFFDGFLETLDSFLESIARPFVPMEAALQIQRVGFRVARIAFHDTLPLLDGHLHLEPFRDLSCDLVLNRQDARLLRTVILAP